MHIAHIAPEMAPFVKIGGLGDVVGSLPAAQVRDGRQVSVVLPGYGPVMGSWGLAGRAGTRVAARYAGRAIVGAVHELERQGVRVLVVAQDELFNRPGIYGGPEGSYGDNGLRFAWFCAAALEALRETAPAPDAILTHDWPAALAPVLLRAAPRLNDPLDSAASVQVIHNLAHQGIFPLDLARGFDIPELFLDVDGIEALGAMNFLKGGILSASMVVTVSPTYAREIVWADYGEGLDQVLLSRGDDLVGILNGLDTTNWDPAHDPRLPAAFHAEDLSGKARCKAALQRELGLREGAEHPLFGVVSRLDTQKGVDLVEMVAPWLVEQSAQLVVLGVGQHRLVEPLIGLAAMWRESVSVVERFDEGLAHRIYAASDFFLMPSRFEPCGLGQMAALRYGALPIVRRTGGLADTVRDVDEHEDDANGFIFEHANPGGLHWACERALRVFREDGGRLDTLRRHGMLLDFSWDRSARIYDHVIERAVLRERRRVML